MKTIRFPAVLAVLALLLLGVPVQEAFADRNPRLGKEVNTQKLKDRITGFRGYLDLAMSYQGLGLSLRGTIGYQWRLFGSKNKVLENNFFSMGTDFSVSPAFFHGGAYLELQPVSILNFKVLYHFRAHFPAFTSGAFFKDMEAINTRFQGVKGFTDGENRVDAARDQTIQENGGSRPVQLGHYVKFDGTFQIKLFNVVAAFNANLTMIWFDFKDASNSQFVYAPLLDIIIQKHDFFLELNGILGYEWRNFLFLVVQNYTKALKSESVRWMLGPAVRWEFTDKWKALKKPYLLFVVRWYLQHRWRGGEPLPNFALVVGTNF